MENGVKQAKLAGRLNIKGTAEVEDQFASFTAAEKAPVLVDMTEVELIVYIGMRMLLSNAKPLAGRGGTWSCITQPRWLKMPLPPPASAS